MSSFSSSSSSDADSFRVQSWDELDISEHLLRGIYSKGFEQPSPIQQQAIKPILLGRDIIAQAQSGTGKTATFAIGTLQRVNVGQNVTQAVILSPTHELSHQIFSTVKDLGQHIPGLRVELCVGGTTSSVSAPPPIRRGGIKPALSEGGGKAPHIIVGCPGKICDLIDRKLISLNRLTMVVIDEADAMIAKFSDQLSLVLTPVPESAQIVLFSATLPADIRAQTDYLLKDPVVISVQPEKVSLDGIGQFYMEAMDDLDKYDQLKAIYNNLTVSQCIIYCNSVNRVITLYESLINDGFPACHIHRNMLRATRDYEFERFKTGNARVLVSTDITARGIDIQQVSVVINFDLPKDIATYIHRIGRSGRWGRKGFGINLVTNRDIGQLKAIERFYKCNIREMSDDVLKQMGTA